MGLGDVFVNQIARLDGTIVAETDLPSGVLRTPAFVPKVEAKPGFDMLLAGRFLRKPPELICYDITNVSRLTHTRAKRADQRTISGASADPEYDRFRKATFSMTDPRTEFFTYKKTYARTGDDRVYFRDRIALLKDFPSAVHQIVTGPDSPWGDAFWRELLEGELHLALIDWFARYQKSANPSIFLPPSCVVEGNRSLDSALRLNEAAGEAFPSGEDSLVPALYFILHPKVFKSEAFMERLRGEISSRISTYRILALKFLFPNNIIDSGPKRSELRKLLSHLDGLKKLTEDSFIVMAIDVGEPGLALVANGVDTYAEPLLGFIWFPQARARSKETRTREAEDLDFESVGAYWIHPTERTPARMTRESIANLCDCAAHTAAAEGLPLAVLRRIHNYNVRSREIDMGAEAVGNRDSGFFRRVLGRGSNKNLLDLLSTGNDGGLPG